MSMNETNGAHTSPDTSDETGQTQISAGKPVERFSGVDPSLTTGETSFALHGAKIPSREPVLALVTSDPAFSPDNPVTLNGYTFEPASRQAELAFTLSVAEAEVKAVKLVNAHLEARITRQAETIGKLQMIGADLTAERDAAAENARRERDQHTETVRSLDWVQDAFERHEIPGRQWGEQRGVVARLWVEDLKGQIARLLRQVDRRRDFARVVTSPRFYSEEQREAAALDMPFRIDSMDDRRETVDAVAQALGMRRAAA